MNYYPRYPADYLSKTLHLSLAEDGAYTRLLDWCYANEKPIPHEKRYEIVRVLKPKERAIVDRVLAEFFTRSENGWSNKRVSSETAKAQPKILSARENGRKGGRPRKNPVGSENPPHEKPSGLPNENPLGFLQKPSGKAPQNQNYKEQKQEQDQKPCAAGAARFAEFWASYPRHEGRKKAMDVWRRKRLDGCAEMLIADVERRKADHRPWRDGFIPHAERYLRDERWNDDIDTTARGKAGDESMNARVAL